MKRRDFLLSSSIFAGLAALGPAAFKARALSSGDTGRSLVVVFLRGGCDGLNMIVPHGDDAYYAARPTIAIRRPLAGRGDAAIDLDGFFGLHPALAPLHQHYDQGQLAVLPSVHFPQKQFSHFESQALMERGGAGDGWLNRCLEAGEGLTNALAVDYRIPESLRGRVQVPAYSEPLDLSLAGNARIDALLERVVDQTYAGGPSGGNGAVDEWHDAATNLIADREHIVDSSPSTAEFPNGLFARRLAAVAALLREDRSPTLITLSLGGWDTHSNQGGAQGRQATALATLAAGLSAFWRELGTRSDDVAVLVQTEFGRTLDENASRGTDHGVASAWMVFSNTLRPGIHLGARGWRGLEQDQLAYGRALAPSVDYRDVYADLLAGHLALADVESVIPTRPGDVTGLA